jgi:ribosomal-protein-alanine N-acetyltransferase
MNRNLQSSRILISERLTLRKLSKSDSKEILQLRSDPEINKFLDRKPAITVDDALNFIKSIVENESGGLFYWAITKSGEDKLMGTICLFNFSDTIKECEIGYELLSEYQGHGIMLEAAKKVIDYAVTTLGIKTIAALTHKDNQGSVRLLQKLNFNKLADIAEDNPNLIRFELTS